MLCGVTGKPAPNARKLRILSQNVDCSTQERFQADRALETFKALGTDFVSYSEQMDTSTPAGKIVFTVLGALAELERSLIVERVKAGLRNARANGKRTGRPASDVDASRIASLRASNVSWHEIGRRLGVSARTARRTLSGRGKTLSADTAASAVD